MDKNYKEMAKEKKDAFLARFEQNTTLSSEEKDICIKFMNEFDGLENRLDECEDYVKWLCFTGFGLDFSNIETNLRINIKVIPVINGIFFPLCTVRGCDNRVQKIKWVFIDKNANCTIVDALSNDDIKAKFIRDSLYRFNINITEVSAKYLSQYFQYFMSCIDKIDYIPSKTVYTKIGFLDGFPNTFFASTAINLDNNSELIGRFAKFVKSSGSIIKYVTMLQNEVTTPQSQLALVLGLSAPIVSHLSNYSGIRTLLTSFVGKSSIGKSTASMLAVSTFSNPTLDHEGMFRKANGTVLSLTQGLIDNYGVPMVIDDLRNFYLKKSMPVETMIYTLESGQSRSHMTRDYTQGETSGWRGTIILTDEHDLIESSQNAGALVRIIEFNSFPWTTSAANADTIQETVLSNYGLIGPLFMEHYFSNYTFDDIVTKYEIYKSLLKNKVVKKDTYTDRIVNKCALITLTADLAKDFFQTNFSYKINIDEITQLLVDTISSSYDTRNQTESVYNNLKSFVLEKFNSFTSKTKEQSNIGKIASKNGRKIAFITPSGMDLFYKLTNSKPIARHLWKDMKCKEFLFTDDSSDGHQYDCRFTINGVQVRGRAIYLDK